MRPTLWVIAIVCAIVGILAFCTWIGVPLIEQVREDAAVNTLVWGGNIPTEDSWRRKPFPAPVMVRWILRRLRGAEPEVTTSLTLIFSERPRELSQLADLPYLESIALFGNVNDSAMRSVASVKWIKKVYIRSEGVSDLTLEWLANCSAIRSLNIGRTAITGRGLSRFAHVGQLREVWLNPRQLEDGGGELGSALRKLDRLWILDAISQRQLDCLRRLPDGCRIYRMVNRTKIHDDPTAIADLTKSRPDLILKLSVSAAGEPKTGHP
jgi:hypothetical protein